MKEVFTRFCTGLTKVLHHCGPKSPFTLIHNNVLFIISIMQSCSLHSSSSSKSEYSDWLSIVFFLIVHELENSESDCDCEI